MQVRPLYHKTSIMVSKMNAISLVTVEVGNPRLVWKFSGVRDPGFFPLVALLSLRSCHSLHGRGSSPLPRPFSLKEGEKRGRRWHRPFPSRETLRSHRLDFCSLSTGQNPVIQPPLTTRELGNTVLCLGRHMSRCKLSHCGKERMDVEVGGQLTVSATICMWSMVWRVVHYSRNMQPLELCYQSSENLYCGKKWTQWTSLLGGWGGSLWWELAQMWYLWLSF